MESAAKSEDAQKKYDLPVTPESRWKSYVMFYLNVEMNKQRK